MNYLVPVDARLERDTDVRFETVALDDGAGGDVSGGSFGDLNEDLLGDETLVAYAAAGTTAADGHFFLGPGPFASSSRASGSIEDEICRNAADFEAYLGQFPDGVYRTLATNRLAESAGGRRRRQPPPAWNGKTVDEVGLKRRVVDGRIRGGGGVVKSVEW